MTEASPSGDPAGGPALLRAWPSLVGRIPHRPLLPGPTPVEALALDGLPAGRVYVKRDERCTPLYGGNKPRKLEFILAAARARGARRLVTTGALATHHGLATTILGGAAGMATSVVVVRQPVDDAVREALLLQAAYGAQLVYGSSPAGAAAQVLRVLAAATLRGERPFLVATGGSSLRGMLGMVSAGLELAEQVARGELPRPGHVYLPVGTGGSLAGLVVGLKLAGLSARVEGVLVTDILPPSPRRLARRARTLSALLHRLAPGVPAVSVEPSDFGLLRDWLGAGYGAPTAAAREALESARAVGLELETTYTAKCLAAMRDLARRGELPDGPVLFWNTHNAVDVANRAPGPPAANRLPRALRRLLADG